MFAQCSPRAVDHPAKGEHSFIRLSRPVASPGAPWRVALVGDAPEGVFDRQLVDAVGILVEPFFAIGVVLMIGIGTRVEQVVEKPGTPPQSSGGMLARGDISGIGKIGSPARISVTVSRCSQPSPKL